MRILDLKLTYRCDNDCGMCCQDRNLRNINSDLKLQDVKEIYKNEENTHTIDKVVLTGGEPTLSPEIIRIVEFFKKQGIKNIQLQTNAKRLKDPKFLARLTEAGINSFGISLHGHCQEVHERFTCTRGSFKEVILALENLKNSKASIALNAVITQANINNLGELVCFVQKNNYAHSLQFAYIHITGKAESNRNEVVRIAEAAEKVKKVIHNFAGGTIKIYTEAIPYCLMRNYEKHVAELYNDSEIITYDKFQKRDFTKARKNEFKAKARHCEHCLFDSICEGPWYEYPREFGFDEFIPVTDFRSV